MAWEGQDLHAEVRAILALRHFAVGDFLHRLSYLKDNYLRLRGRLEAAAGLSTPSTEWGRRCLLILKCPPRSRSDSGILYLASNLEELACAEAVCDLRVCSQEASPRARMSTFTSRAFGRSTSRPSNRMRASQSLLAARCPSKRGPE